MESIPVKVELVARCGLYCGACKSHLSGKCPGCRDNPKADWCAVRTCCGEKNIASCAQCTAFPDPRQCGKFNNIMSRLFGFFFDSDRAACIEQIRRLGPEGHAQAMADSGRQTISRKCR